jgi:hypothetical protein
VNAKERRCIAFDIPPEVLHAATRRVAAILPGPSESVIDLLIYLFIESYSVSAAYCAAMPGVTGVADSGRGADVDPHRPTSSLAKRNQLPP